ncbi:MAG: hypothetical protein JST11_16880 [Acidobacteria bacterium]|nr:hypothetical protein [Acidobacteriota bacterium]
MQKPTQSLFTSPQFSSLSIIYALWRRKVFIAALTLLGAGTTAAIVSRLEPVYTAYAVILVESQKIPETFVPATVQTALEAQLDTLKQQVLSTERLWSLVEGFGLYRRERSRATKEEILRRMRDDITISLSRGWSARGPGAFEVEYQAPRPETAADVANRIGMFFINENMRQRTDEAEATSRFLNTQLGAAEGRLREQEGKLKEFKLTFNGELPEQEGALLAAVAQGRTELLGIQDGMARAQQSLLILESSLSYAQSNLRDRQERVRAAAATAAALGMRAVPASSPPPPPTPLEQAQSDLRSLRTRYRDSHPEIQRMMAEVARLQKEEEDTRRAVNAAAARGAGAADTSAAPERRADAGAGESEQADQNRIQELAGQIAAVRQELDSLDQRRQRVLQEVADSQERIRKLPVRVQQLAVITRDYETSKQNYQSLLSKKLAADVATDMERWHKSQKFVMLDAARPPQKPTKPRRVMLTAAGAVFSLALSTALAFLLELRRGVLLGEWELPTGTSVLGRIPRMKLGSA